MLARKKKKGHFGNREVLYKPEFYNKKMRTTCLEILKDLMTEILCKCERIGKDGAGDHFIKALHIKGNKKQK